MGIDHPYHTVAVGICDDLSGMPAQLAKVRNNKDLLHYDHGQIIEMVERDMMLQMMNRLILAVGADS